MFYKYTCVHNQHMYINNSVLSVKCDQCEGTFWTYNIKAHYVVSHPSITTENIPNYISENEKNSS